MAEVENAVVNIAILGYGTVGSGVYQIVNENQAVLRRKCGKDLVVKYVLDLREFPGDPVQEILTHRFEDVLEDDSVRLVVEVMGGVEPANTFVTACLGKGKSVVTSNKELVARHGSRLIRLARENHCNFLFEASVGGGIPIIRPLISSLTADDILEIKGIVNGTTNYILSEMTRYGKTFEEVLALAQEYGYAEKDPAADVEGYDACRKDAILCSLAFGKTVDYQEIPTEGITHISAKDVDYAKAMGRTIKLLAYGKKSEKGVTARVAPYLLPDDHPLSRVDGVFNAVFIKGNMLGDTMYYGRGAGKLPTASAVVSDVVDAIKHFGRNIIIDWSEEKQSVLPTDAVETCQLIRISESLLPLARQLFPQAEVVDLPQPDGELAVVTGVESEHSVAEKIQKLAAAGAVLGAIRMQD